MKKGAIAASLLAFSVFVFSGCALLSKNKSSGSGMLEPSSIQRFGDVPVPSGFDFLAKDSYTFESSGVRVGVLRYRGRANADRVVDFYREQMPMYNWNLLNVIEFGERQMNFDREAETCVVTLVPKGKSVTIVVSVGPKSQQPKKASKPVK